MAANKTPNPRTLSPEIPVVSYPTPNIEDLIVVQDVDTRTPGYVALEYGAPHPDPVNFPNLRLVSQAPLDQENNHMWVRRIYANDRRDEDAYNYALKYSASDPEYPIYIRTSTILRSEYAPLPAGSSDPLFPSATLISEEVVRFKGEAEDGVLDSLYLKVLRVFETLPGPVITRYETNDLGQTVAVSSQRKFYGDEYEPPVADALTSFSSEVGEGNVITDTVRVVPEVFSGKLYASEVPDPAPTKFRVAVPAVTEEETVEGTATAPTLSVGDLEKSEQQQTKFTKRKRRTSRPRTALPKSLSQIKTTREKQRAVVTETLQEGDTNLQPSATVDVESEALGDGTYVVRKTEVPSVFDAKAEEASRPDVLPPRFTAKIPTTTVTEVVAGSDSSVSLGPDEYRAEKQRISEFEVRQSAVSRSDDDLPQLSGRDLEEAYNIQIPYTEHISNNANVSGTAEVEPLSVDKYLVRTYDPDQLEAVLGNYMVSYPTRISLDLPRRLQQLDVVFTKSESTSDFSNANDLDGRFRQVTQSDTGTLMVSSTITPDLKLVYKDVWGSSLSATQHIFFLKGPVTTSAILSKLGCSQWPTFKPQGAVITMNSKTKTKRVSVAISRGAAAEPDPGGVQFSKSVSVDESTENKPIIVTIPPCLTSGINVSKSDTSTLSKTFTLVYEALVTDGGLQIPEVRVNQGVSLSLTNQVQITIPATNPGSVPSSGLYLTDCRVEFFKYGWFIVQATVFNAGQLA